MSSNPCDGDRDVNVIQVSSFSPPLYLQRYHKVVEILERPHWVRAIHRVVDLGCGEGKLLNFVRRMDWVRELVGVDQDAFVVEENHHRCAPTVVDYVNKRPLTQLDMFLMVGDVTEPDARLLDMDAATAIELIEHMEPETLRRFVQNVFGFMTPKIVLLTTPNSEFNVRLQNLATRFRHYDHKFEWTRLEFETWCGRIVQEFPAYDVSFFGVGTPPDDGHDTGHCSQGALFVRKDFLMNADNGAFHSDVCVNVRSESEDGRPVGDLKVVAHYTVPLGKKPPEENVKSWLESGLVEAGESDEDEDAFVLFEEESQGDNDEDDDNVDDFCQTTEGLESEYIFSTAEEWN